AAACPWLLEEVTGLAEGARVSGDDALAAQIRGELAAVGDEACTAFAVGRTGTCTGEILIGQTSDTAPEIEQFGYVLHLIPDDRPEILMWTFGGMIGYHGLNAHGVAHFAMRWPAAPTGGLLYPIIHSRD